MEGVRPWWGTGRVVFEDSWYDSLITAALLYAKGLYQVLAIRRRRCWPRGFANELLDGTIGAKVGDYSAVSTKFPNLFSAHGFHEQLRELSLFKLFCVMFRAGSKVMSYCATASSLLQYTNTVNRWLPELGAIISQRSERLNLFDPPPGELVTMTRHQVAEDFAWGRYAVEDNNHTQYGSGTALIQRICSRSQQLREFAMVWLLAETNACNAFNYIYLERFHANDNESVRLWEGVRSDKYSSLYRNHAMFRVALAMEILQHSNIPKFTRKRNRFHCQLVKSLNRKVNITRRRRNQYSDVTTSPDGTRRGRLLTVFECMSCSVPVCISHFPLHESSRSINWGTIFLHIFVLVPERTTIGNNFSLVHLLGRTAQDLERYRNVSPTRQ